MASHVLLLFFNAMLLSIVTSAIAIYILKKEYAPIIAEETEKQNKKIAS